MQYKSICPLYKLLWSKSKWLHAFSYYVSNDMVKLKHEENVDPFE